MREAVERSTAFYVKNLHEKYKIGTSSVKNCNRNCYELLKSVIKSILLLGSSPHVSTISKTAIKGGFSFVYIVVPYMRNAKF